MCKKLLPYFQRGKILLSSFLLFKLTCCSISLAPVLRKQSLALAQETAGWPCDIQRSHQQRHVLPHVGYRGKDQGTAVYRQQNSLALVSLSPLHWGRCAGSHCIIKQNLMYIYVNECKFHANLICGQVGKRSSIGPTGFQPNFSVLFCFNHSVFMFILLHSDATFDLISLFFFPNELFLTQWM